MIPYFYVIQDIATKIYYAGSCYNKKANPQNLLQPFGYRTHSRKIVWPLINKYGIERFIIRKIKIFSTAEDAYNYETKFLKRVDAKNNSSFYNMHNNEGGFNPNINRNTANEKRRKTCLIKYGVEVSSQATSVRNKLSESAKKRQRDPLWKATIGKQLVENTQRNRDAVKAGISIAITKANPQWKNTIGLEMATKLSNTLNSEEWKETKGKIKSAKLKVSLKNQKKIKCPHCDKIGISSNMSRWHFDNCKQLSS